MIPVSDRVLEKLISFDIWVMYTFLGGLEGETISAAAWNARITGRWWFGWMHIPIDLIFLLWERDHCRKAWEWQEHIYRDIAREQKAEQIIEKSP